ncbi:MAG: hypothetical protein WDW36_002116 [Sanguina aurantia]
MPDWQVFATLRAARRPLNDELVELGLAPALVATATSPDDNHVEVREVVRCLRQAHADYFELWQPLQVDQALVEEVGVPEDARVTLSVALDAGEVPSITGQYRRDESHLVVLDGLLSESGRVQVQDWLTAAGHDHSGQPPDGKWERSCVDREGDVPTWGLHGQMLEALRDNPPPAIVALQSALAALYPEFNIRHMPAPVLSDAELPSEEEEGEEEGPEPLSSFVGNAVMYGDSVAWHVDADPASFPSYSPWVHNYGYYVNREPGRPLFVSMLLYFNDSWPEDYHSETLFLDPETNSGVFVRPVPGRVVLMDQDMTHRISVPSKESQGPRYSLVWKLVFFPKSCEQPEPGPASSSDQDSMSADAAPGHESSSGAHGTSSSSSSHGADIKKAKECGFHTVSSLFMVRKSVLYGVKGLSENKADKMIEAAKKMFAGANWMTGTAAAVQRERSIARITTGATEVDLMLGGGFETKSLSEMYGEYRTGKTQLIHMLCVTTQMPVNQGGAAGKVAFIDTEGTFRPERIRQIAERYNLEPDSVLDNILVATAHSSEHQQELLISVCANMAADQCYKLLVIDSITALFRVDFTGRGELADRQQKLNQMLSKLKKIAEEFNVAVVYTNQVMSDPSGGAMFVADPKKAVGGHVMAHASTTRLSLRKGKAEQRLIKVIQSPCLAEAEASFIITADGVRDYKD